VINLTEDYSKLIDDYDHSAILNKSTLRKVGEATGTRYVLYVKLLEQVKTQGLTRGAYVLLYQYISMTILYPVPQILSSNNKKLTIFT